MGPLVNDGYQKSKTKMQHISDNNKNIMAE